MNDIFEELNGLDRAERDESYRELERFFALLAAAFAAADVMATEEVAA